MDISDFLALVQEGGLPGLIAGLGVLVVVFSLSKSGVVVTPGQKRAANVVLSILLAGLNLLNPTSLDVLVAGIAAVGSSLVYKAIKWAVGKYFPAPAEG